MKSGVLHNHCKLLAFTLLLGLIFVAGVLKPAAVNAAAGVNQQVNFQGRLLNAQGATVPDGYYNIEFKIYQDGDGQTTGDTTGTPSGSLKWTEDYLNVSSQGVMVKNGFLSVQLGSITPFGSSIDWNQDTLWLSMNIAGTGTTCTPFASCSPDGEMTPMKRLSSTPYSLNSGRLGGLTSASFLQLAQGVQTDASTATNSVYINKTGTGNIINLQSGGTDAFIVSNSGDQTFGANANHTISVASAATGVAGKTLTVVAGAAGTGSSVVGGDLVLQGGAGSGTGISGSVIVQSNGSNSVTAFQVKDASSNSLLAVDTAGKAISAGTGLTLAVPNIKTIVSASTGGTIANATTYYYGVTAVKGAVESEISPIIGTTVVSATNTNTLTINWSQSFSATGYKVYRSTTSNFSTGSLLLATIGSGSTVSYVDTGSATSAGLPPSAYTPTIFRVDSAANNPFGNGQTTQLGSMYYNTTSGQFQCYKDTGVGGSWSDCGVTTLQGGYDNATSSSTVPSIKLDTTHGTLNIQDADTSIGADLLDVRASNASGLGTRLFGVSSTGMTTVQNATDQSSLFRVLDASGQYIVNVNSASGYFISNATRALSNGAQNPGFEAGGSITSGEEGWNGPAQASIVNDSTNAHSGNYGLQITPNGTSLKTYAGSYYGVSSGDSVYFEGWMKNSGTANGTANVIIEGYDKDKALISSSAATSVLPGTTYTLSSTSYTVPSNVKYVRVAAAVNATATTGTYYFDDFYLSTTQRGQQVFQNTVDSANAFTVQSAGAAQTLLRADTTNNILKVGDSTGTDTATTILMLDGTTANPTTSLASRNGGLFYRSDSNSLKAIIGGAVVDICTTAVTCSGYSASASASVQLQLTTPGTAQTGNFNITGTGILSQLQTQDQSAVSTSSSSLVVRTGNATGTTSNSGNLTLDVGSATGTLGTISIGHAGVVTTMAGTLAIQSANSLELGTASSATGSILFNTSAGANTITLRAPGSNPTSSYVLTLPQNLGSAGDCLKDAGSGALGFSSCSAGSTTNLQNVYDNSSSPATITLADAKDLKFVAQDTTTDPNVLVNLQCVTSCGTNGRFAIQNSAVDVFTVSANGGGITLARNTQIGSSITDATQINLQLDSSNLTTDSGTCTTTTNQGAMYYNTTMGSIRACMNGSWSDMSNPDTLGLLSFGVIPSSGANPYDLPALVVAGVSGPCKVSWNSATSVHVEACVAYSGGRRVNITATNLSTNSATTNNISLTTANNWGHVCLTGANSQPAFTTTTGQTSAINGMPTPFSISAPILCLADVVNSTTTNGNIGGIYDTRTFTSTLKEAANLSTAAELGMLVDSSSTGGLVPSAACSTGTCSGKLYGVIVASDGTTSSGAPNAIVGEVGPAYVKAISGTAGQFIKPSTTVGYAATVSAIPNNAFYYSGGNARTSWSNTCSSASNCNGSLYANFIVR